MSSEFDPISSYFNELKEEDSRRGIPDFHEVYPETGKIRILRGSLIGIAASLLLGIFMYKFMYNVSVPEGSEVIVIELSSSNSNSYEILNSDVPSIDSWQSPTNSLINDFYDF